MATTKRVDSARPRFAAEVYRDRTGEYRWRLRSVRNGKIVADGGEGYTRRPDAKRAFLRVVEALSLMDFRWKPTA